MKKTERVAIVGMGAVGAVYAAFLHRYLGRGNVAVLCEGERKERYQKNPFCINGEIIDFDFVEPDAVKEPYDLILVGVKYGQLQKTAAKIAPCVGEGTIILSLLNGIDTEEALQTAYGEEKVPRCFVVGIDTLRVGTKVDYASLGTIFFGFSENEKHKEKIKSITELFEGAKIPLVVSDRMEKEQWWKFMLNCAMNQLSAVLNIPYGYFRTDPHVRELSRKVCQEVVDVANRAGISMGQADIDRYFAVAEDLSEGGITSMCADVRNHRKTEVEMLSGVVNRLGEKYGIATPYNTMLFHMIKFIETHYER